MRSFNAPTPDASLTLLPRKKAAQLLGVATQTLAVWACSKRYPLPYVRVGRRVMYRLADVIAFIDSRTVGLEGV